MQTYLFGAEKAAIRHDRSPKICPLQFSTENASKEKDAGYVASSSSPCSDAVFSKESVPQFGVANDFIHEGYRPPLNYRKCIQSAFAWNNETLNIWTHILATLVFGIQMLRFNWVILPKLSEMDSQAEFLSESSSSLSSSSSTSSSSSPSSSYFSSVLPSSSSPPSWVWSIPSLTSSVPFIWNSSLVCYALCMAFSAGFHLFSCHSLEVSTRWLGLDFTGMSVATLGCYLSGIFCAFACDPFWRDFYLSLVLGILLLIFLLPSFLKDYWEPERVWFRAGIQIAAVTFGVVPISHAIVAEGGFSSSFTWLFLRSVFDLYFYAGVSFFFYASKLPERVYPGRFDFFGQSHQIWHLCIFYTLYNWNHRTLQMLEFRFKSPCDPSTL